VQNFAIEFRSLDDSLTYLRNELTSAANVTLVSAGISEDCVLTIALADDQQLRRLNRTYAGEDRPTDVLSFSDGTQLPSGEIYLGDVVLSAETAGRQAKKAGHDLAAELQLLVVHGVLHLLGHDHDQSDRKQAMWTLQAAVIDSLGLHLSSVPE